MAADEDGPGPVLGFGSLSPYRPRPAYATTVEDSVYVAADARGRGRGPGHPRPSSSRLAADHGFHAVIARTEGANEPFDRACTRRAASRWSGVEREVGRKHGRWLDVVELQLLL